jgi:Zn-finger nucleic acid-binding protein
MLCPKCNEEMLVLELRNVEIDFCADCNGIWLDEGELELLLPPESKSGSAIAGALQNSERLKGKGDRKCPVCGKRMLLVDIPIDAIPPATTPSVEVDKCPRNHGLWFDKGELQTITSAAKGEPVSDFLSDMFAADND